VYGEGRKQGLKGGGHDVSKDDLCLLNQTFFIDGYEYPAATQVYNEFL
jgi:hypothetical protein